MAESRVVLSAAYSGACVGRHSNQMIHILYMDKSVHFNLYYGRPVCFVRSNHKWEDNIRMILGNWCVKMCIGYMWLGVGTSGVLL
jgi:hypothetical protein